MCRCGRVEQVERDMRLWVIQQIYNKGLYNKLQSVKNAITKIFNNISWFLLLLFFSHNMYSSVKLSHFIIGSWSIMIPWHSPRMYTLRSLPLRKAIKWGTSVILYLVIKDIKHFPLKDYITIHNSSPNRNNSATLEIILIFKLQTMV